MHALIAECPADPMTQMPVLPPPPVQDPPRDYDEAELFVLEDEPAVTACTDIEGHVWVEKTDPCLGTRYKACKHCGDSAPAWADIQPFDHIWFGRSR